MVEAKLLRKKLKNGLIVDKWDLVNIIEKQQAEIERLTTKNLEWLANWNEQQVEIDEMLKGIKQIRYWLESTCPDGFADEIFRCLPVAILKKIQNDCQPLGKCPACATKHSYNKKCLIGKFKEK